MRAYFQHFMHTYLYCGLLCSPPRRRFFFCLCSANEASIVRRVFPSLTSNPLASKLWEARQTPWLAVLCAHKKSPVCVASWNQAKYGVLRTAWSVYYQYRRYTVCTEHAERGGASMFQTKTQVLGQLCGPRSCAGKELILPSELLPFLPSSSPELICVCPIKLLQPHFSV